MEPLGEMMSRGGVEKGSCLGDAAEGGVTNKERLRG